MSKPSARPSFFEEFRTALGRLAEGLVRAAPVPPPGAIAAAAARLGGPLPPSFVQFLDSFDGADLFHESIVVAGVGPEAFRSLVEANRAENRPAGTRPDDVIFAESTSGDVFVFEGGSDGDDRVLRIRADTEERWLAGSSFPRWLAATLAREQLLYDSSGEFVLDAFEPDGEELTPPIALRQAERASRRDPEAAEHHYDLGVAWRRMARLDRAREAFARAAELDPANPWPWFDLGRSALALTRAPEAARAFRQAADAAPPDSPDRARFLAWAARAFWDAGARAEAETARTEALSAAPGLPADLRRAVEAAGEDEDEAARAEAEALLAVFDPTIPLRRKLPVVAASPPPAPADKDEADSAMGRSSPAQGSPSERRPRPSSPPPKSSRPGTAGPPKRPTPAAAPPQHPRKTPHAGKGRPPAPSPHARPPKPAAHASGRPRPPGKGPAKPAGRRGAGRPPHR